MDVINKVKNILTSPKSYFKSLKKERGISNAFVYFVIVALITLILPLIVSYFGAFKEFQEAFDILGFQSQTFLLFVILFSLFSYIFYLGFSFVIAGLLHIWILIFGGKSEYSKTYQLFVYSSTPGLLFGWIPFVGFLSGFYNLYLLIIGTPIIYKEISMKKSILMYIIPNVLVFILFLILFGAVFFIELQSELGLVGKAFGF